MPVLATLVEWEELLETVVASAAAGIGVTLIFSLVIWGIGRFGDLSREGHPVAASAAGMVALLSLLGFVGVVVVGIVVMTSKG